MQLVSGNGWIECMPSFITVAQLLLSQPMNFLAHPQIFLQKIYEQQKWDIIVV